MEMDEERTRILQMVSEGKVTAEDGVKLLNALRSAKGGAERPREGSPRWVRIRLPFGLVTAATKLGARFSPQTEDLDWEELITAIKEGASGKIVDVEDDEGGEKVEIFVE
jgi:hypothetical protein